MTKSPGKGKLRRVAVAAVGLFFVLTAVRVFRPYVVTSSSMADALLPGDFVIAHRLPNGILGLGGSLTPERGEIWVLQPTRLDVAPMVKRIVGLPDDTLSMRGGRLYVNGRAQEEPYASASPGKDRPVPRFGWQLERLLPEVDTLAYQPTRNSWGPLTVPESSYFALGDNRSQSTDSRYWGFVTTDRLIGRVSYTYFSYGATDSASPLDKKVRWERFGPLR